MCNQMKLSERMSEYKSGTANEKKPTELVSMVPKHRAAATTKSVVELRKAQEKEEEKKVAAQRKSIICTIHKQNEKK